VKRMLLIFVVATIAAALTVGTATADPTNSPQAITVPFDCGGEEVMLTVRPPTTSASAHVSDDSRVFLAKSGFVTVTDLSTNEVVAEGPFSNPGKGKGFEGDLVTCSATYTFDGFQYDVTVNALIVPRGR
jgi:hypothetical protein